MFFAKGVIFVEGWAEQIFLPAFVNLLKDKGLITQNLTEAGVSIVNVGSTAFLKYSKIFQRKDDSEINIPIAIITDSDVAIYEKNNDKQVVKRNNSEISLKLNKAIQKKEEEYNYQNFIKVFLAKDWTFEYALYKSTLFSEPFQTIVKSIHTQTDFSDFEKKLAEKLLSQSLAKTQIAYDMSIYLNEEKNISCITKKDIESDSSISYLVEAVKFVCR